MTQQHVPAGSPSGGQFMPTVTSETTIDLSADGTFQFPPAFNTADELLAFYSREQPPPEVISDFRGAANEFWNQHWQTKMSEWDAAHPDPGGRKHETWREQRVQFDQELKDSVPTYQLPDSAWGPLTRIQRMVQSSFDMTDEAEKKRVWNTQVKVPLRHGAREAPMADVFNDFDMNKFSPMRYRDRANAQMLDVVTVLNHIRNDAEHDRAMRAIHEQYG